MAKKLVQRSKKEVAFFLGISFWLFFFLLPFFALLKEFLQISDSLFIVREILQDSWYQSIFFFTFQQAFLSAFFTILVGVPTSFVLAKFSILRKLHFLFLLPFIMPTILVVLVIIQFWGHQGVINQSLKIIFSLKESPLKIIYSLKGILIAHIFFNLPVVLHLVGLTKQQISSRYLESALVLNCSRWRFFWKIDFPLLSPEILKAFGLVFLLCLNSFAIVWVLGGGKNLILESLIYEFAKIHLDYQSVLIFTFLQILLGLLLVRFFYRFPTGFILKQPTLKKDFFFSQKGWSQRIEKFIAMFWALLILLFILGPLVKLFWNSLEYTKEISFYWWIFLFKNENFFSAFFTSFKIAFFSSLLSFILLLLIFPFLLKIKSQRKNIEMLFLLPLSISLIALGLGWFLFYQNFLAKIHFPLILYLICIHAVIFFAYWIKIFLPFLESMPSSWLVIKNLYGYSWVLFIRHVLFSWLKKPFLQTFSLIMALSFGELNILLMVADSNLKTLTTSLFSAISGYQFSYACTIGAFFLLYIFLQNFLLEFLAKNKK